MTSAARSSTPPRVVIDINLVLSALIFANGRLTPLRQAWQSQRIQPIVSRVTATELIGVLAYPKFKLTADEQQELLADYLPYCTVVTLPAKPPKTPACRDPHDIPFLQLAIAGKADYLVSGDQDLLDLSKAGRCPIVTPAQFLEVLTLT